MPSRTPTCSSRRLIGLVPTLVVLWLSAIASGICSPRVVLARSGLDCCPAATGRRNSSELGPTASTRIPGTCCAISMKLGCASAERRVQAGEYQLNRRNGCLSETLAGIGVLLHLVLSPRSDSTCSVSLEHFPVRWARIRHQGFSAP